MKVHFLVALASYLAFTHAAYPQSSDDGAARACEASIIGGLVSPASYQAFKVEILPGSVEVIYDASNAFGALLRDKATCLFVSRPDGLHLSTEPDIAAQLNTGVCIAQVQGWVASGNLTERAARPFLEQCSEAKGDGQGSFLQVFEDLGVEYPVPPGSTTVAPME